MPVPVAGVERPFVDQFNFELNNPEFPDFSSTHEEHLPDLISAAAPLFAGGCSRSDGLLAVHRGSTLVQRRPRVTMARARVELTVAEVSEPLTLGVSLLRKAERREVR